MEFIITGMDQINSPQYLQFFNFLILHTKSLKKIKKYFKCSADDN